MKLSPLERFHAMTPAEREELRRRWSSYQADPRPGHHDLTFADAEVLIAIAERVEDRGAWS